MKKLFLLLGICLCLTSCASGYKKVTGNVYKKYDKFQDCSFYESRAKGSDNFYIYAVESSEGKFLRIVFRYDGKKWIFFNRAYVMNSAGDRFEFAVNTLDKTTDTYSDGKKVMVKEIADIPINDEEKIQNLYQVLQGEKIELCLQGEGQKIYKIKKTAGLLEIIDFYSTL